MTNKIIIICRAIHYSTSGIQTYLENLSKYLISNKTEIICEYSIDQYDGSENINTYKVLETHKKSFIKALIELSKSLISDKQNLVKKLLLISLLIVNRYALKSIINRLHKSEELLGIGDFPRYTISSVVYPEGLVSIILKLKYNIPAVILLQGSEIIHFKKKLRYKLLFDFIFRNSDIIVANSEYMKNYLKHFTKGVNNILANNLGVDIVNFSPKEFDTDLAKKLNIPEGKKIILSVSNIIKMKGIDLIVKALKLVETEYSNWIYLVVGNDNESSYVQTLKEIIREYKIEEKIKWIGSIDHAELNHYYNLSDFLVLPSRSEAFGLVTLEANACGKTVIGSAVGGIKETIIDHETGLLFESENEKELAEKILLLLNDSTYCYKLGENAYDRVIREFTWEKSILKLQQSIEKKTNEFKD